jgi:uncharacterized protein
MGYALAMNTAPAPTAAAITVLLRSAHTIAIVGLSPKPHRDSFGVAQYLQSAGYRIIPVNPVVAASSEPTILGEHCYASLADAQAALPAGQRIDIVDIFRNSDDVPPVVQDAIAVKAGAVWMQLGIANAAAALAAQAAGLQVVQNRCIKIDHRAWVL